MAFKYANKATQSNRRGDETYVREDEGRRGRGRTGNGNGDSQLVCARWKANPTTCANCGYLASHDVAVSMARAGNEMAGQGDLLMTVPVERRLPWTNVRSQLTQFIDVRNTLKGT